LVHNKAVTELRSSGKKRKEFYEGGKQKYAGRGSKKEYHKVRKGWCCSRHKGGLRQGDRRKRGTSARNKSDTYRCNSEKGEELNLTCTAQRKSAPPFVGGGRKQKVIRLDNVPEEKERTAGVATRKRGHQNPPTKGEPYLHSSIKIKGGTHANSQQQQKTKGECLRHGDSRGGRDSRVVVGGENPGPRGDPKSRAGRPLWETT